MADTVQRDEAQIEKILATLGGVAKVSRAGVWFNAGGDEDEFSSYQRISDTEMMFKEYDELGMAVTQGRVEYTKENGTVAFTLRDIGGVEIVGEGWFAISQEGEDLTIYAPWKEWQSVETKERLMRILKGYCYLNSQEWQFDRMEPEHMGVGLSGEEEGRMVGKLLSEGN